MRMRSGLFLLALAVTLTAAPIKILKLSVTNPTAEGRLAEKITIRVGDLKKIAPDFDPAHCIVTTSEAATLQQDAATLQTVELAAQTAGGELTFHIPLLPNQTRIVNIAYGDVALLRTPHATVAMPDAAHLNNYGTDRRRARHADREARGSRDAVEIGRAPERAAGHAAGIGPSHLAASDRAPPRGGRSYRCEL